MDKFIYDTFMKLSGINENMSDVDIRMEEYLKTFIESNKDKATGDLFDALTVKMKEDGVYDHEEVTTLLTRLKDIIGVSKPTTSDFKVTPDAEDVPSKKNVGKKQLAEADMKKTYTALDNKGNALVTVQSDDEVTAQKELEKSMQQNPQLRNKFNAWNQGAKKMNINVTEDEAQDNIPIKVMKVGVNAWKVVGSVNSLSYDRDRTFKTREDAISYAKELEKETMALNAPRPYKIAKIENESVNGKKVRQVKEDQPQSNYTYNFAEYIKGTPVVGNNEISDNIDNHIDANSSSFDIASDGTFEAIINIDSESVAINTMTKDAELTQSVKLFMDEADESGKFGGGWAKQREAWVTEQEWEVGYSENTYNRDNAYFWGAVYEYTTFEHPEKGSGIIIMWHLGNDVRGNYKEPEVWFGDVDTFFSMQEPSDSDSESEIATLFGYEGDYDAMKKDVERYVMYETDEYDGANEVKPRSEFPESPNQKTFGFDAELQNDDVNEEADEIALKDKNSTASFDDYTKNDTKDNYDMPYWTQVCDACAKKHKLSDAHIDNGAGNGICGVVGCDKEADHYYDFTPDTQGDGVNEAHDDIYQCGSCEKTFKKSELVNGSCPHCDSGNWTDGYIDETYGDKPRPNSVKSYDGFYISYNDIDTNVYGSDTTALVIGNADKFYILQGDHRKAYTDIITSTDDPKEQMAKCIEYYKSQKDKHNEYSDKLEESNGDSYSYTNAESGWSVKNGGSEIHRMDKSGSLKGSTGRASRMGASNRKKQEPEIKAWIDGHAKGKHKGNMEEGKPKYDLSAGHLGNGMTVWNRAKEEHGDYQKIAHIDVNRKIEYYIPNPPKEVTEYVESIANGENPSASTSQPDMKVFKEVGIHESVLVPCEKSDPWLNPFVGKVRTIDEGKAIVEDTKGDLIEIAVTRLTPIVESVMDSYNELAGGYSDETNYPTDDDLEPTEDDYIIADSRYGGYDVSHLGKVIATARNYDEAITAVKDDMRKHEFFPNVWTVSDHDNYELVNPNEVVTESADIRKPLMKENEVPESVFKPADDAEQAERNKQAQTQAFLDKDSLESWLESDQSREYRDNNFIYHMFDTDNGDEVKRILDGGVTDVPYWLTDYDDAPTKPIYSFGSQGEELEDGTFVKTLGEKVKALTGKEYNPDAPTYVQFVDGHYDGGNYGDILTIDGKQYVFVHSLGLPEEMEHQAENGDLAYEYRGTSFLRILKRLSGGGDDDGDGLKEGLFMSDADLGNKINPEVGGRYRVKFNRVPTGFTQYAQYQINSVTKNGYRFKGYGLLIPKDSVVGFYAIDELKEDKDNVQCSNCGYKGGVSVGADTCPKCDMVGSLAWVDGEEQEIVDDVITTNTQAIKEDRYKSDDAIADEFKGMKIVKIDVNPSKSSGYIEIEFPEAGESVGGGTDYVTDSWIKYDHNGKIAFDNWYPEDVYLALVDAIEKELKTPITEGSYGALDGDQSDVLSGIVLSNKSKSFEDIVKIIMSDSMFEGVPQEDIEDAVESARALYGLDETVDYDSFMSPDDAQRGDNFQKFKKYASPTLMKRFEELEDNNFHTENGEMIVRFLYALDKGATPQQAEVSALEYLDNNKELPTGMYGEGLNEEELAIDPLEAYMQTLRWSSKDDGDDEWDNREFTDDARNQAKRDVEAFIKKAGSLLDGEELPKAMHNFALTRNGHGAGFWDGGYTEEKGEALTKLSELFGVVEVYVTDDGELDTMGGKVVTESDQISKVGDKYVAHKYEKGKINYTVGDKESDVLPVSLFDAESATGVVERLKSEINAPVVSPQASTLGGKENVSLIIRLSLDPKDKWENNIYHNSRFAMFHIYRDGGMELFAKHPNMPKFRKSKGKSIDQLIQKINQYIDIAGTRQNEGCKR